MSLEDARAVLEKAKEGALATLHGDQPYASATGFLFEKGNQPRDLGTLCFFLSDLAQHTRNLKKNPKASFLIVEENPQAPIHEKRRVTLQGKVGRIEDPWKCEKLKTHYLKRFPKAEMFFKLGDFHFYEMPLKGIQWYGGFGKAEKFGATA